jgi:hypothetical protein
MSEAFSLLPVSVLLLTTGAVVLLWLNGSFTKLVFSRQRKGDIQRPATYAYGSVRQYPKVSLYRKAEEFFFYTYWRLVAMLKIGRLPNHVLYGENFVEEMRMSRSQAYSIC